MCVERGSATDAKWKVERAEVIVDRFECSDIFMLSMKKRSGQTKTEWVRKAGEWSRGEGGVGIDLQESGMHR
jgi:hypothetical protein